jgi:hypothetical protein
MRPPAPPSTSALDHVGKNQGEGGKWKAVSMASDPTSVGVSEVAGGGGIHWMGRADGGGHGGVGSTLASGQGEGAAVADVGRRAAGRGGVEGKGQEGGDDAGCGGGEGRCGEKEQGGGGRTGTGADART